MAPLTRERQAMIEAWTWERVRELVHKEKMALIELRRKMLGDDS